MLKIDKARAVDAADVLNDFVGDFITGVMVFREYYAEAKREKIPADMMIGIQRMCLSHIVLAFAKFEEFYKHYHDVVPDENRFACKEILRAIRNRNISMFRNQCVGHIWNNDTQRPLRHSEVMESLQILVNHDFGAFLQWINDPKGNVYPSTVVSIVETVRDNIVAKYGIRREEIIDR